MWPARLDGNSVYTSKELCREIGEKSKSMVGGGRGVGVGMAESRYVFSTTALCAGSPLKVCMCARFGRLSAKESKDLTDIIADIRGRIRRERINLKPAFQACAGI